MTQKLQIIPDVNGTDVLFQTETPFIEDSLVVLLHNPPQVDSLIEITEMGDSFFKTTITPPEGSDLHCYYTQADLSLIGVDTLSVWERANIEKMMSIITFQSQSITNLETALDNKVSYIDFDKYTEVIEKQLQDIKVSLLP